MKIEEICNCPDKKPIPLKQIINIKDWNRPIFPIEYNLGVDWDRLENTLINFNGYSQETEFNKFYMISINGKFIILVCFDKVQHEYRTFCLDQELYKTFIKIIFSYATLPCIYNLELNEYLLPNEEGYNEQWEDYD